MGEHEYYGGACGFFKRPSGRLRKTLYNVAGTPWRHERPGALARDTAKKLLDCSEVATLF
jgi:hypothetical protein